MGVPYDELRKMDNPVVPVSKYYKNKLKPGESLWWAADADPETVSVPPIIRLWTSLSAEQKNYYTVQGYALFPEILGSSATKYQRYALWLATRCSIVNTNIRDQFSAGGKVSIQTIQGTFEKVPAAYGKIKRNAKLIAETIFSAEESTLIENWKVKRVSDNRLEQWCRVVSRYAEKQFVIYKMLCGIFGIEPIVLPPSKE
jgi:hypothetical protein